MKKYVRAATEENTVLEIVIDFCFDFDEGIETCFNPNLNPFDLDMVIEDTIEEYYTNFMNQVADKLVMMGFEILEGPEYSNRAGSKSCYFTVCNKDEYNTLTVKIIMNIRISDHRLKKRKGDSKNKNRFTAREEYYRKELENYRILNKINPEEMDSILLEIFVSGQKFGTFRDAIHYISNIIKKEQSNL